MSGLGGLLVFLLLHLLFVLRWSWFSAVPWSGYEAATARGIVEPWFVHTPRSLWLVRAVLFGVALLFSLRRTNGWLLNALALWLGAAAGVAFAYATTSLPALEWGSLGYLLYPMRVMLPVLAGALVGAILSRSFRRQTVAAD